MKRWTLFVVCAVAGLAILACGLLVPAHLRAVDTSVLQAAGRDSLTLSDHGLALAREEKLGAARMIKKALELQTIPGGEKLSLAIMNLSAENSALAAWDGVPPRFKNLFESESGAPASASGPFTEFVIRLENREKALRILETSPCAAVQELLRCRDLTNTTVFPPSSSPSGQAFDAAVSVCGLLLDEGQLSTDLSNAVFAAASTANRGDKTQPLEQALMDLLSLGQRLNWGQLTVFVSRIEDADTLDRQANFARKSEAQLPVLFSAVELSGKPAAVAAYLMQFSQTGLNDLGASMRFGSGGLNELLQRNQRLHFSALGQHLMVDTSWRSPELALYAKWFLYLTGGFLLAAALHFARPTVSGLERPLQVRGFHVVREVLFAPAFLLAVLLLSEPFLTQENQKTEGRLQLRLPMAGGVVPAGSTGAKASFMNPANKLTMLLFFTVQGLLYLGCILKLAEIRRQRVPPRMKLKLLENEEHLFDAGLYLGFLGTIISFILSSMNKGQQFNLMVAYSSTSFGILFVSFFKIFHLRPARRKLLLEAEAENPQPSDAATINFAAPL